MSTGYNCRIFESDPGRWFYILQDWDCPVGAWDWTEYATTTGPFPSKEAATKHLSDHEANPGGWFVSKFDPTAPAATIEKNRALAAKARTPKRSAW